MEVIDESNYKDFIEFTIINDTNDDDDITIDVNSVLSQLYINEKLSSTISGTYTVKRNSVNKYKIRAKNLSRFILSSTINLSIIFDTIDSNNLQILKVYAFENVIFRDINQLLNLKKLSELIVRNIVNVYSVDSILQTLQKLHSNTGIVSSINLDGSDTPTPSPIGINAKDWLSGTGVSVFTN
jgi:hypothetical protein